MRTHMSWLERFAAASACALLLAGSPGRGQAQAGPGAIWSGAVPPAVVAFERQVKRRLLESADLASELRGSCEDIARVVRLSADNDFAMLRITSEAARSATDEDLCEAYIARASFAFEYMVALINEVGWSDGGDGPDLRGCMDAERAVLGRFWPDRTLPADLDPDSAAFIDWMEPSIGSLVELDRYTAVMRRRRSLATHGVPWRTPSLSHYESYHAGIFGDARRLARIAPSLEWPTGRTYSTTILAMVLVIEDRDGQPRVVYATRFSS